MEGLTPENDLAVVLARMDERLAGLVETLKESNIQTRQTLADHESRIRDNEKWRWQLPAALITALVSASGTLLAIVFKLGS